MFYCIGVTFIIHEKLLNRSSIKYNKTVELRVSENLRKAIKKKWGWK